MLRIYLPPIIGDGYLLCEYRGPRNAMLGNAWGIPQPPGYVMWGGVPESPIRILPGFGYPESLNPIPGMG